MLKPGDVIRISTSRAFVFVRQWETHGNGKRTSHYEFANQECPTLYYTYTWQQLREMCG